MGRTRLREWVAALVLLPCMGAAGTESYQLPGGAADYADPYVAAGFRALFTCSAHFLMHRPLADIEQVELADTAALGLPAPRIDEVRRLVAASDGRGAEVLAAYRDTMGCTLLPPGSGPGAVARLPYVARELPRHDPKRDYPWGARVAPPRLGPGQRALIERAFDGRSYGEGTRTTAVLLIHAGRVVAERYAPGFGIHQGYRTWSTAKSISASLIGIAAARGLIDLDAPAPIPEWQGPADPRRVITPRQLLWMASGLWSEGSNTNALYFAGQDVVSAATTTPLEVAPGTRWKYANNGTLLLLRALRARLADDLDYLRFPYDALLYPIGMYDTWMETDHAGNFIGSSQVYTTARDIGRLALLYLNDGVWNGRRILPEGWAEFVATPAPAQPPPGEWGYGAQFWLLDGVSGLPPRTFTTAGNKGQYGTVVRARDLVVVRTGVDPLGVRWNHPQFVADVLGAFTPR